MIQLGRHKQVLLCSGASCLWLLHTKAEFARIAMVVFLFPQPFFTCCGRAETREPREGGEASGVEKNDDRGAGAL